MSRIIAFGTYNARKHPRIGILIDGLREHGIDVHEINAPLTLSTAERVQILKKPWKLAGFARTILSLWRRLRRESRIWVAEHGTPDAVLVGYMGHFDVLLARRLFPHTPIILDHLIFAADTAKDRGAKGLKVRLLRHLDSWALNAATLVLTDTREHKDMLRAGDSGMVVPVGAPEEWYAVGDVKRQHGGIVFYGLYTPLQGTPIIAEALRILWTRGVTPPVTLIGKGQDYPRVREILRDCTNVRFVDWVDPHDLPSLVARHDISLGIFSTTPKGLRVVPNKVYQSLATGCAVVTSDTPPQRRVLGDGVAYVEPGNPEALADALKRLVNDEALIVSWQNKAVALSQEFKPFPITTELAHWIASQTQERH